MLKRMMQLPDTVISEWRRKHPDLRVLQHIKSGKEADLWLVQIKDRLDVLKVYTDASLRTRAQYTQGQWVSHPSLRKAVRQKTKVGRNLQQKLWTKREYYLLQKLHHEGAIVPEVYAHTDNAILMQYIGDEDEAAPRLADIVLDKAIRPAVLRAIEESMQLFLAHGIVHADLSAYNILWWDNRPWVIDFPQAADIRRNPDWHALYERDLKNIRSYFAEPGR